MLTQIHQIPTLLIKTAEVPWTRVLPQDPGEKIPCHKKTGVLVKTANHVKRSSHPDQTWERGSDQRQRKNRINAKFSRVGTFVRYTTSDVLKSTVNIEIRRKKTCVHVLHEGEGAEAWRRFVEHCGPQQASPWLGMPRQKLPFDVGDLGTRFERLPVAWCRSGCADLSASSKKSSPSHVVVATWSARYSFPGNAGPWGRPSLCEGFSSTSLPRGSMLSARRTLLSWARGHARSKRFPATRSSSIGECLKLFMSCGHLDCTLWIDLLSTSTTRHETHCVVTCVWASRHALSSQRLGAVVLVIESQTPVFFLRDEAFFPEWTAWSVMNVPRHVSAIRTFIFILFQFVIHMMRRVQPLVVVVTQGAHVKTSNGLGSRVLVVHRPPSHFPHLFCTSALLAVESLCLEMLQMSSKLSVSFSRPLARFAPLLSVAVSCWLPGSAVPSCVDGFSLTRCPRDISRITREVPYLRQSTQSLRSSSGFDERITCWSESSRETCCIRSDGTRNSHSTPLLQKCKLMKSDRETYCKVTSKDLKNYQKTRSYPNCAPKQVWIWSKLDNPSTAFRSRAEWRIDLHAENTRYLEMKRKVLQKGGSKAMHNSVLSRTWKFARHTEDTALKLKVPSLFEDQTTSWIRIVNGVEKYVSEAMPIQEEERASGKPAAKARSMLKPSSTSNWNFYSDGTEKMDRHWSEKIQGPLLLPDVKIPWLSYFDTRKVVEEKMSEFLIVEMFINARNFYQMVQDTGQTK